MQIRKGTPDDVPQLFELVTELAIYEKAPEQVTNTPEQMLKDGFGEHPLFGVLVAEVEGKVVGMSLYYYRYSTWKGKRLYLEDIIVTENHRGQGLGKLLFEKTVEEARQSDCTGMMWQVLDWNRPAINFYKAFEARFDTEWWNCHLDF
ncbi:GNAT family N-acetyltransferase [Tellurirhabdus bombi]|uniref:GNAT family N-acetyltransferase n=1 Tax=Tellurirhabdus bombi TaxID=2907205 RepID=UPI001F34360B|nr:GNAT family N-acetyltransferase [Tellurirhabdus bombi]